MLFQYFVSYFQTGDILTLIQPGSPCARRGGSQVTYRQGQTYLHLVGLGLR